MKFLVLLLAIVPTYAISHVSDHLLRQEFQYPTIDHVRERRQSGNLPPEIQQLLHAQNSRRPLVPVPAQPIPNLGSSHPAEPQQLSQTQVSQYKPQVTFSSGVQQPDYRAIQSSSGGQHQRPIAPQQPQYRPSPQSQNYNNPQQPQYSTKLPPHLQQLLQYQSNLANSIPQRG